MGNVFAIQVIVVMHAMKLQLAQMIVTAEAYVSLEFATAIQVPGGLTARLKTIALKIATIMESASMVYAFAIQNSKVSCVPLRYYVLAIAIIKVFA